ncbi:helicase RepA family protein [Paraburkholderia sediminicola]|uniref:helicase RepA family protein n=1 Tax=Paraburkholderia sediminicola TaxID=458836 RepID=UPI0038B8D51E
MAEDSLAVAHEVVDMPPSWKYQPDSTFPAGDETAMLKIACLEYLDAKYPEKWETNAQLAAYANVSLPVINQFLKFKGHSDFTNKQQVMALYMEATSAHGKHQYAGRLVYYAVKEGFAPPEGAKGTRYKRLEAADLINAPPQRWLVKGTLPETGVGAIYGPPGSGKSFLAIDLCVAIAEGKEWFGLRTTPADVTYICLEGAGGLGKRLDAWTVENKRDMPPRLKFITEPFDLQKPEDITELCAEQAGKGGVVMIDTLNRASPGADENSGKDMSVLLAGCAQIQRITGGVVLAIHHTGKDAARGLRGHSSLLGALDASIEVTRTGEWREWRNSKVRDEQDGTAYPFRLQRIEMGFNQDGDAITSCVVRPVDGENPSLKPAPKSVQFLRAVFAEMSLEGSVTVGALLQMAQGKFVPEKDGKAFVRANYKAALASHLGTGSKELADDKVLYLF